MGCSGSGNSWLSKLDLKLGSKFAVKGRGGQGGLTASCPDTTEGVVELVQLPTVGVEHLEVASRHIFLPESLRPHRHQEARSWTPARLQMGQMVMWEKMEGKDLN